MALDRRRFVRNSLALGAGLGLVPDLVSSGGAASGAPAGLRRSRGGTLTSLDPHRLTSSLDAEMAAELFVALTTTDAAGRLVPGCASRWQSSSDGKSWTFTLRPDCRWSDGRPLLAADFVQSFRRFMSPDAAATLAFRFDAVRGALAVRTGNASPDTLGVTAPNAATVRFDLDHPDTDFPKLLAVMYPVAPQVIAARGRDWAKPQFLVTNGAYRVKTWAQSGSASLLANNYFWDAKRVSIAAVEWVLGLDDTTRIRLFRSGQLDVATISDGTSLAIAKRELGRSLHTVPFWGAGWVGINTRRGALQQADVRRALALAVDRDILCRRVRQLDERPWDSIVPAAVSEYGPPVLPSHAAWSISKRVAAARMLLASHGITPRTRLALKAIFSANPVTQRSFLALAAMWRPLGVDVQLVGLETRAYSMQLRAGDYDLQDYVPFATIHTPGTFVSRFASDSFLNFMYYRSAEVDQLIASAERQLDPAARIRMYRQVEAKLLVDQPIIPLYSAVAHRLVAGRVRGWVDHSALASPSRFLSVMD